MIFNHNATQNNCIFFDSGNQRTYITGGWEAMAEEAEDFYKVDTYPIAYVEDTICVKGGWGEVYTNPGYGLAYCAAVAYTAKKIDVTNLKKINFEVTKRAVPISGTDCRLEVGLTNGDLNAILGNDKTLVRGTVSGGGTVTVDVSSLSGEYIIYAIANGISDAINGLRPTYMEISKIWNE